MFNSIRSFLTQKRVYQCDATQRNKEKDKNTGVVCSQYDSVDDFMNRDRKMDPEYSTVITTQGLSQQMDYINLMLRYGNKFIIKKQPVTPASTPNEKEKEEKI